MLKIPYPELDDLLDALGKAGRRMTEIEANEAAAGNVSACLRWPVNLSGHFPLISELELPQPVPKLAGATILVSGSGRRLREIGDDPQANLAGIVVDEGGRTGRFYTSSRRRFERVTSEFNSHLAVHHDQVCAREGSFHAIVHAQPLHLTYLSHVERYQDETYLNTHLLRWQPETIINLPEGLGFTPFFVPGSTALMQASTASLRKHRLTVWARHGVMARSSHSVAGATDLIEYAETAARYEYLNLTLGEMSAGLSPAEIRSICAALGVEQNIF